MAKLTLSIEPERIAKAKRYVHKHQTSISKIVSDFLADITDNDEAEINEEDPLLTKIKEMEIPDWIKKLSAGPKINLPDNVDYKDLKYEYFKEKYGL